MTVLTWSDDRVEQLKALWDSGLSASQIAGEIGNVTRNAVIGKVHRLGLASRMRPPSMASTTAAPTTPRAPRKPRNVAPVVRSRPATQGNTALAEDFEVAPEVEIAIEVMPQPVVHDNVTPINHRMTLLELNEATCHWPIGDPSSPDFFFCGARSVSGLPYCAQHSRVAYQPVSERRRSVAKSGER
ncbi:MAG: GcrA family cell cycle regulator [Alphaproteobacteria bacterium]|nr:GcrA family cell cycle regulator [Alphaproteobacteria bacterium]